MLACVTLITNRRDAGLSLLIKPMEMMDGPMTVPDLEAVGRRDRRGDEGLGMANRTFRRLASGEKGCDS